MMTDELKLFQEDAIDHLDEADRAALRLDEAIHAGHEPPAEALNALFRCVHTIKGNAGIMGFADCVAIAHALEWGLDRVRAGALRLDADLVNHVFTGLDALRSLVGALGEGDDAVLDAATLAARLEALFGGGPAPAADDLAARFPGWALAPEPTRSALARRLAEGDGQLYRLSWPLAAAPVGPAAADDFERLNALGGFLAWRVTPGDVRLAEGAYLSGATADELTRFAPEALIACVPFAASGASPEAGPQPEAFPLPDSGLQPEAMPLPEFAAVPALALPSDAVTLPDLALLPDVAPLPLAASAAVPRAAAGAPSADPLEGSVRVGTPLLDKLMSLMGELVLTRNQILQHLRRQEDQALAAPVQRLNLLTTELQEAVMRTRMQPVGQVWERLPRLVRDYCQGTGKQVQLLLEGSETELDKSLLEAIKDPLTHLVRNAIDHGLEGPAARVAAGKDPRGTLRLSAHQDGGQIILEVRDDGRGLDHARIREKAQALGLVPAEALARLGEAELVQLIFHPGFSTAAEVTAISGRGVGMDVVKANLERIGGTVELASTPGRGTTFRLCIPLTLAVIPALVILAGGERFALPQASVLEVVRTGEGLQRVEQVREALVYRLRDALVPVLPLGAALGLGAGEASSGEGHLVVVQAGPRVIGLAVDAIGDTEEIVVKPLHRFLQALDVYAGVTIMGDGHACMILDASGLAARAVLTASEAATSSAAAADEPGAAQAGEERLRLLLCRLGGRTYGLPMDLVARLEVFAPERLERLGDRLVVQYGQALLPVLAPEALLGLAPPQAAEAASVVVLQAADALVGLRVEAIADIVEVAACHPVAGVPGVAGAAVIGGATTEILDVPALLQAGQAGLAALSGQVRQASHQPPAPPSTQEVIR